tara:strand:- start:9288 stop:9467 length:180 start_codon:yes stop_codon:yes gene_type:complete
MESLTIIFAIAIIFGALGAYLAENKGRKHYEGFLLGFLFGFLGVIVEFFLPSKKLDKKK